MYSRNAKLTKKCVFIPVPAPSHPPLHSYEWVIIRLVPTGAGTRKLRGTAARERQELARVVVKDRYMEAVRRYIRRIRYG